ncbi:DNA mismatch repair protein MutH [Agarivorans sp. Toyoura001]|uniref:DNA mismatch repair endonuclease MutH n=1 Tax=Agarivorans sp. Toyoura001 TaxID=2283141 RepID=UPI0010EA9E82|nr:DNA mismatch repair endonuclease MutH [Agarivorans sp. Toyoura001]GDY27778.1 DNA mismatch repair protein MutH [Agarivorans sp. Toyoura001]
MISTPKTEQELFERAQSLAGLSLGELAQREGLAIPKDLKREKGWGGQLIEWCLGATAGSKPIQDFPELGIELKTIPIDNTGKPLESTYVCITPLTNIEGATWHTSNVYNKLSRVLWIPILAERQIPVDQRIVANPILWSPTAEQEQLLRSDWEELVEMISFGQIDQITARHGQVLQLRPKAANNKARTAAIGPNGQPIQTLPRGYYLRTRFTSALLRDYFQL